MEYSIRILGRRKIIEDENKITCPKCKHDFNAEEALSSQIESQIRNELKETSVYGAVKIVEREFKYGKTSYIDTWQL